jgi:hypothetical protein
MRPPAGTGGGLIQRSRYGGAHRRMIMKKFISSRRRLGAFLAPLFAAIGIAAASPLGSAFFQGEPICRTLVGTDNGQIVITCPLESCWSDPVVPPVEADLDCDFKSVKVGATWLHWCICPNDAGNQGCNGVLFSNSADPSDPGIRVSCTKVAKCTGADSCLPVPNTPLAWDYACECR